MNDFDSGTEPLRQRPSDFRSRRERLGAERCPAVAGLLVSGGLDSCILLKKLLDDGRRVKPFYIRSGLCWETVELRALKRYLCAVADRNLEPLSVLDLPLADVYADHWSVTGRKIPEAGTPDEAVYLPGRNALLTIKAAVWCQMRGIEELAMATLRSNPFEDASTSFFDHLAVAIGAIGSRPFRLTRPFGEMDKRQVMELGETYPLELTFSCIAPCHGLHCGECNKCAERQAAFRLIDGNDPTCYASVAVREPCLANNSANKFQEVIP